MARASGSGRARRRRLWRPIASLAAAAAVWAGGCALYRHDRCYVEDAQYQLAYNLFIESGSLDVVRLQLEDLQWSRCKVNEIVYRLTKEFEIVAE